MGETLNLEAIKTRNTDLKNQFSGSPPPGAEKEWAVMQRLAQDVESLVNEIAAIDESLARRSALDGIEFRAYKVRVACDTVAAHERKIGQMRQEIENLKAERDDLSQKYDEELNHSSHCKSGWDLERTRNKKMRAALQRAPELAEKVKAHGIALGESGVVKIEEEFGGFSNALDIEMILKQMEEAAK